MSSSTLFKRHEKRYASNSSIKAVLLNGSYEVEVVVRGTAKATKLQVVKDEEPNYMHGPSSISTETSSAFRVTWKMKIE